MYSNVLDISREFFLSLKKKSVSFSALFVLACGSVYIFCPFHLWEETVPGAFSLAPALNTIMLPTKVFLGGHSKSKDKPQRGSHFFKVCMFYFNHIGKFCIPVHADFNRKTIFPKWMLLKDVSCFLLLVHSSTLLETFLYWLQQHY